MRIQKFLLCISNIHFVVKFQKKLGLRTLGSCFCIWIWFSSCKLEPSRCKLEFLIRIWICWLVELKWFLVFYSIDTDNGQFYSAQHFPYPKVHWSSVNQLWLYPAILSNFSFPLYVVSSSDVMFGCEFLSNYGWGRGDL